MAYELRGELILNSDEFNSLLHSFVHPNHEMLQHRDALFEEIDQMGIRFGESIELECPNITINTEPEYRNTVEQSYIMEISAQQKEDTSTYTVGYTTIQYSIQDGDDVDFLDTMHLRRQAQHSPSESTHSGHIDLEAA